jgi:large subunit ribosomal protein L13e
MVSHNNPIPNPQMRKHWQGRVKVRFDQPAKAKARKQKREQTALSAFPRPVNSLRPSIHPPSIKHNHRVRYGRGFTPEELKAAGVPPLLAATIGISVDKRRKNHSKESLDANVQRLKEYLSKLVLFPRNAKAPKTKGPVPDASADKLKQATQVKTEVLPVAKPKTTVEWRQITEQDKKKSAFKRIRRARRSIRDVGYQVKKKKAAESGLTANKKKEDAAE